MVTYSQRLTLHVSSVSPLPKSYKDAFNDPNWKNAMTDEYNALINNNTWTLVPRPKDINIIHCMWLFRHKYLEDGTLSRYKARLVSNSSTQHVYQLDVKNAFLHGDLSEIVYMHQPPGFKDSTHPDYVCLLQRSLYGLKQAPRAWFQRFATYITRVGFSQSQCDSSLFIYRQGTDTAYLLLYVDDIVLTASSERKYATEILEQAHMVGCNSSRTPINTESKLGNNGDSVSDPTLYRSLAGSLQYLTFTRPNILYVAGCPTTRSSTSGHCVFLGNNLLSWSSKRQPTLSRSSAEAEYIGVANVVAETCWLRNLFHDLYTPLSFAMLVYYDNVSAVYLSSNPVQHQRTNHIEIDIHFVRDLVAAGHVRVLHVPSRYQYADIFTK
ncbi:ribonuclease H-like domain-containing protein, partial [Tanacetum coccineum]